MRHLGMWVCLAAVTTCASMANAVTLNVGPTRIYTTLQAAVDAAISDDVILIDPGTYVGTQCTAKISGANRNNLTIRGNGGRPILDMGPDTSVSVDPANGGMGIITVSSSVNNVTFENLEFVRAADSSTTSIDAAGVYWNGIGKLTVRDCVFRDCQHAVRTQSKAETATPVADVLIERCRVYDCGNANPATASINIGFYTTFTLQHSWLYNSKGAQLVLSQAMTTKLLYNRIGDEITDANTSPVTWGGTGNDAIDIRFAGLSYVIGNMITKRPGGTSGNLVKYGYGSSTVKNLYDTRLYCLYNTFNGQRNSAQTFININTTAITTLAIVANNIFLASSNNDTMCNNAHSTHLSTKNLFGPNVTLTRSPWTHTIPIVNAGSQYYSGQLKPNAANLSLDYALTANCWVNTTNATDGAIGTATPPGTGGLAATGMDGFALTPTSQLNNWPANNPILGALPRTNVNDLGAFSYPSVDAGAAQKLITPTNSTSVTGTICDAGLTARSTLVQSYQWSQESGPAAASLGTPTALSTTVSGLTAPGVYVLKLQYTVQPDSGVSSPTYVGSDTVTITVAAPNQAPVIDTISNNLVKYEGQAVNLTVTAHDPNAGDVLTYSWTRTAGQTVSLSGAGTATCTFTAPTLTSRAGGTMSFQVTVADGNGADVSRTSAVQVYMAGDANHDWRINVGDLQVLVATWGSSTNSAADFDGDGTVNVADLQALVSNWTRDLP